MVRVGRLGLWPCLRFSGRRDSTPARMRRHCQALAPMLLGIIAGGFALFTGTPAHAACDNHDPTTGQTATCDTSPPTPDPTRGHAVAGSTNVTCNSLPGGAINVNTANGLLVRDQSQVTNSGAITVTCNTFDGITSDLTGNNNILINRGVITTTGTFSEGIFTTG